MRKSHLRVAAPIRVIAIAFAVCLSTAEALASDCPRAGDRVLLVSTRPVGCTTDPARLANGVHAAELSDGRWNTTPFDAVMASLDPTRPVIFYVHGNQIGMSDARRRGLDVYRSFVRRRSDDRAVQFVVFSWNSDKVPGLLRDYRVKAARTRPVAWQLAWVLDHLPDETPVGLLGYSYGARVSSGAAHLLAGGGLSGLRYQPECDARHRGPMRAVFMAAAYDACWNGARGYHGEALHRIDTLLTTVNPRDPAMKYFKWVPPTADPPALGGVGPRGLDRDRASRVRLQHVADSVGRSHDLYRYLAAPGLMRSAWTRLNFVDMPLAVTVVADVSGVDSHGALATK